MTDEQLNAIVEVLRDPEAALALLPEEERQAYRDSQQSIIDARRAGERMAHTIWIC